jgi:hypothetical protein
MRTRRLAAVLIAAVVLAGLQPTSASAAASISEDQAVAITSRLPAVQRAVAQTHDAHPSAASFRAGGLWVVTVFAGGESRAQVEVDAANGRVHRITTGVRASFPLARGSESGVGARKINHLWAFLPLSAIFVLAFFDWRRPFRLLHLDLLAVAALGISYAFFLARRLDVSVSLVYPTLAYVAVRALLAGFRPRQRPGALTWLPLKPLIALTLGLLAARIALLLADPFVMDVGYASAAGADRVMHGLELYTRGGAHFDTYGPVAYLAYVPFDLIWPFHESQQYPPAAEAAAIAFDLLTVAGLVALGRRLRPASPLGWALALAWVACPFTGLALTSASNDGLVAALLVWTLVTIPSPAVRGLLSGAAAAAKFAPALLGPLLMRGPRQPSRRAAVIYAGAFFAVVVVATFPLLPPGGPREFYDATIGFQLDRFSPFSIWSRHPSLDWLKTVLELAAVALAIAVAFFPRGPRAVAQVAALATAVLVAEQIPLAHWFYLYVPWFLPLYCVAVFSESVSGEADARSAA